MTLDSRHQDSVAVNQQLRFGRYEAGIVSFLAFLTVFSVTDLLTTSVALARNGLYEGNSLIVLIANSFNMNLISTIALTKVVFVSGAVLVSILGIRSEDKKTKKIIFAAVGAFAMVFIFASLNNVYWITQTG